MSFNKVGKFEGMKIVKEFDQTLIELYGVNMTDAEITRLEAISAVHEASSCVRTAVELIGKKRGMPQLAT
jgi:hypothetical protein